MRTRDFLNIIKEFRNLWMADKSRKLSEQLIKEEIEGTKLLVMIRDYNRTLSLDNPILEIGIVRTDKDESEYNLVISIKDGIVTATATNRGITHNVYSEVGGNILQTKIPILIRRHYQDIIEVLKLLYPVQKDGVNFSQKRYRDYNFYMSKGMLDTKNNPAKSFMIVRYNRDKAIKFNANGRSFILKNAILDGLTSYKKVELEMEMQNDIGGELLDLKLYNTLEKKYGTLKSFARLRKGEIPNNTDELYCRMLEYGLSIYENPRNVSIMMKPMKKKHSLIPLLVKSIYDYEEIAYYIQKRSLGDSRYVETPDRTNPDVVKWVVEPSEEITTFLVECMFLLDDYMVYLYKGSTQTLPLIIVLNKSKETIYSKVMLVYDPNIDRGYDLFSRGGYETDYYPLHDTYGILYLDKECISILNDLIPRIIPKFNELIEEHKEAYIRYEEENIEE